MTFMARIEFYDGTSALAHEAQVSVYNGTLIIRANGQAYTIEEQDIAPTLSTPNGRRFINLSNNMALEFHDNADAEQLLDTLNAPHLRQMRWFDRHYRTWPFIAGALVTFVGLVTLLYFFALPVVAERIADRMPSHLLDDMSQEALVQMEDNETLQPSKLSKKRQLELLAKFNALKKPDTQVPFKLHFYSAPDIGPNAFALPSGDVVLLDELVKLTTSDDQTMGVLSHELGHVAHRHTMRGIIQSSSCELLSKFVSLTFRNSLNLCKSFLNNELNAVLENKIPSKLMGFYLFLMHFFYFRKVPIAAQEH